ncbi:MAG: hypothetical protein JW863_08125 [Chitinispirillaceae bacterium]|nr:hypothetical protein [Chitinispirillaceae bacterium]
MADLSSGYTGSTASRLLHGWISVVLMVLIVSVGCIAIYRENRLMSVAYLVVVASGMLGVLYAFCAKCSCKNACRHIFLGKLTRFLPRREVAPYTVSDYTATVIGFSPMLLFPQYWLFSQKPLLLLFWQLTAALVVEIFLFICRGCENSHCPARKIRK